ncbi:MAG: carboxypeptidase-like regulatory domain-containing protein, partial [Alistipes sp.]|nr:carboxypeptidase-like regulatory domain-containing protein [Alistipes sp.]
MKKTLLLMLSLAIGYMASAQTIISGTVVDEKNQPIVGALVAIPNTSQRTATDLNGSFIIEVPKGTTEIEIDNIGYRTKSIECNTDNSSYSAGFITMQENKGYEKSNEIFRLGVEARFDYLNQALEGNQLYDASGFKVRYFNLRMDGQITPKFTYSWRQRFNNINKASDFVNNTDWLHLTYKPTDNWAISAGKQVVMIGGWEYDRAPIDVYYCSEYWNNVNCFQLGASVAFTT